MNSTGEAGTCCIVLHTHLPWVAHAGAWPVGEEWLHQAWSASYRPLVTMLERLAAEDRRDLLTLGVTPVLAAMLDDPYCLRELHTWLGFWRLNAEELAARPEPHLRALAEAEFRAATAALGDFENRWRHGASPLLRALADAGVVELLGGPATHPFLPLLDERVARLQLAVGGDDAVLRFGRRPVGIWAPECGHRPGLEELYAGAGIGHFLVDAPTLVAGRGGDPAATGAAWTVGTSQVAVLARDTEVTRRVWSARTGYPGGAHYRDFHTLLAGTGFRPARVTSRRTASRDKAPYDQAAALAAVDRDASDFVAVVRRRLADLAAARPGAAGIVVVACDTELFGHWWHEGPVWLEQVLRRLPGAGVRVTTLAGALGRAEVAGRVDLPAGSWGSGRDWRIWDGTQVRDLVAASARVQRRLVRVVDRCRPAGPGPRRPDLDQLVREAFLVSSSDWAFCVSRDTAAAYARDRAAIHTARFFRLADAVEAADPGAAACAQRLRAVDGPFGALDARQL